VVSLSSLPHLVLLSGLLAAGAALASPQIATKAGCAVCHTPDKKLVGPSYHDIALKYKGRADAPVLLATRVRKGGTGVWGPIPMAPSDATKISDADLKVVIAWILKTP
jgi:cytochrome c